MAMRTTKMTGSHGVVGVQDLSARSVGAASSRSGRGLDRGCGSTRAGPISWLGGLGDGSIGRSPRVMNTMCVCVYIYTYCISILHLC
jgi:hypothetical protein